MWLCFLLRGQIREIMQKKESPCFFGEETMDEGRRFLAKPSQCGAAPYRARHARAAAGDSWWAADG